MVDKTAQQLAEYVADTNFEDLPEEASATGKRLILDTLGVAWAGSKAEGSSAVHNLLRNDSGNPESTVWVHGDRLPVMSTAFVNSAFASALDYDAFHAIGTLHPDIVVLPAAMAMAEKQGSSGSELLTSVVLADDIMCRFGLSTQERTGWFFTSLYGVFAAAIATAKLLRLDPNGIRNALGLAYLNAAGTQQPAVERSLAKRLGSAFASRSGVFAGLLASVGYEGPREPFEGRFGLYNMYEQGSPGEVTKALGIHFEHQQVTIKYYPSCACMHAAINGSMRIAETFNLVPDDVAKVEVRLSPYMERLVGAPFSPQKNAQVAAQFSVQYGIACAIRYRRFDLFVLEDDTVRDPGNLELANKVQVIVDDKNNGVMVPVTVTVETSDGKRYTETVTDVPGVPDQEFDMTELTGKFWECIRYSQCGLDRRSTEAIVRQVLNIEDIENVAKFWSMVWET